MYAYFGEPDLEDLRERGIELPDGWFQKNVCIPCITSESLTCKVKVYNITTATSNLINHLRAAHNIVLARRGLTDLVLHPQTSFNVQLLMFICRDLRSFNVVNNEGFVSLMKFARPDLKLCSNSHLSQNLLPIVYAKFKAHLKEHLAENLQFGTVSTDTWVDNRLKNRYLVINLFYLDKELNFRKAHLKCGRLDPPHTATRIAEAIKQVLDEYEIPSSKLAFVTDCGANMLAAMRTASCRSSVYVVHGAHNLITVDCLNDRNNDYQHLIAELQETASEDEARTDETNDEPMYELIPEKEDGDQQMSGSNEDEEDDEEESDEEENDDEESENELVSLKNS